MFLRACYAAQRRGAALALASSLAGGVVTVPTVAPASKQAFEPGRFSHALPTASEGPWVLARKPYLDDVDATAAPSIWSPHRILDVAAAPGEREPTTFVIYGARSSADVDVEVSSLRGVGGTIDAKNFETRWVQRVPTRRRFDQPQTELVGRFLPRMHPVDLPRGRFVEVWVDLDIPSSTPPGVYNGTITVHGRGAKTQRPLRVRVRSLQLQRPTAKHLGIYYRMFARLGDESIVQRDLADIRAHGVEHLVVDLRPTFRRTGDRQVAIDTAALDRGLQLIRDAGFSGTVVIDSGIVPLARMLGHVDVGYGGSTGDSLEAEGAVERLSEEAARLLRAVEGTAGKHPELSLAVMHLDEVFFANRLGLFETFARMHRATSRLPIYTTFSTLDDAHDALRRRIDPYVDLRANHGYSFEWWLLRGGDANAYANEVRRSGDRAWFYHNERGTYFTARWARLVNGIYLWATPFEAHVTWVYQNFDGNPHDDTDGVSHDFGVAFPDPTDPDVLVPTRAWPAIREGHDDLRYLHTLEVAIADHAEAAPRVATNAQTFLETLRTDVLRPPSGVDPTGLPRTVGTPAEAPLVRSLAQRYDAHEMTWIRDRVEEYTAALRTAASSLPRRTPDSL